MKRLEIFFGVPSAEAVELVFASGGDASFLGLLFVSLSFVSTSPFVSISLGSSATPESFSGVSGIFTDNLFTIFTNTKTLLGC